MILWSFLAGPCVCECLYGKSPTIWGLDQGPLIVALYHCVVLLDVGAWVVL